MECRRKWTLAKGALSFLLACAIWSSSRVYGRPSVSADSLDGRAMAETLDGLLDGHPITRRTTITLKVVDLESGTVLYDRGGDRLLTPASNLKIYTSACALDRLGPRHHFPTRLVATGPIRKGVLHGDLILVGGGNAMLTSRELLDLAGRIVTEEKLRRVEGRLLVDNRRYGGRRKGPGWMWDDDPDYYNMPVTPLMVDFNVLTVRLTPSGQTFPRGELIPPASYPVLCFRTEKGLAKPYAITREPFQDSIEVVGRGPLRQPVEKRITMNDPARWVAAFMTGRFKELGVEFAPPTSNGSRGNGVSPGNRTPRETDRQWRIEGVSLTETLNHFHAVSENAVGEVLLHELAIAQGARQPDWSDGARVMTEWLVETAGLESGSFRLVDGSGLSRYNLISADSAVKLLAFMRRHRHFQTFFDSLRVYPSGPSETGTSAGQSTGSISAKSGGMSGVATISGYARTRAGRSLAFSLLSNGFLGSSKPFRDLRSQVWSVLVRYRATDE